MAPTTLATLLGAIVDLAAEGRASPHSIEMTPIAQSTERAMRQCAQRLVARK
jgi:hypothetical protein